MKQKIMLVLLVIGFSSMILAQGQDLGRRSFRQPAAETVTVSGSLIVAHGLPALKSGEVTYLLGGINRLVGFIDGLKEGAEITIEGSAITRSNDNNLKLLRPTKLTLNGKDYDMAAPNMAAPRANLGMYMHRFNFSAPRPPSFNQPNPRSPSPPSGRQHRQYNNRPRDL